MSTRTASKVAIGAAVLTVLMNAEPIAIATIHGYQRVLSPLADRIGLRCRFSPTCSHYAEVVIERDGLVRGSWRTVKRIARCNPLTPFGTRDDP